MSEGRTSGRAGDHHQVAVGFDQAAPGGVAVALERLRDDPGFGLFDLLAGAGLGVVVDHKHLVHKPVAKNPSITARIESRSA